MGLGSVNSQCEYETASITGNAATGNQTYDITGGCYDKVTVNQTAAYNAGAEAGHTSVRVATIGSGNSQTAKTFSVKSALPNYYSKLTANNCFAVATSVSQVSAGGANTWNGLSVSYNASTGVAAVNEWHMVAYGGSAIYTLNYTVKCIY